MPMQLQKISTCLCFNDQAEQAANFYTSIFKDARIIAVTRCGDNEFGGPKGSVRTVLFQLFGQEFLAVNGGPHFKFSDALSLVVNCDSQTELDSLWQQLSAGGQEVQCGWLTDKFGLSWQVVPTLLGEWASDPDTEKAQRVMQAMLKMVKLDIAELKRAYAG